MTRMINELHNKNEGETCLIVGNALNLRLTPPELFDYPSIGLNTVHEYEGWSPDYYAAVDLRVMHEFKDAVNKKMKDGTILIPFPKLKAWTGDNVVYFKISGPPLWKPGSRTLWQDNIEGGLSYSNGMHVAMKLACYLGFTTLLIIGMEHDKNNNARKFWGVDHGMNPAVPVDTWMEGYKQLSEAMRARNITMLNISENTFVPEEIITRGDWRDYARTKQGET